MGKCVEWVCGWMARNQEKKVVAVISFPFRLIGEITSSRVVYTALRIFAGIVIALAAIAHAKTGRLFYIPAVLVIYVLAFVLLPRLTNDSRKQQ